MSILTRRVKQLEQRLHSGQCPVCMDKGKYVISHTYEDEPIPEVEGCSVCGKVDHYIIRYREESAIRGGPVRPGKFDGTITGEQIARKHLLRAKHELESVT